MTDIRRLLAKFTPTWHHAWDERLGAAHLPEGYFTRLEGTFQVRLFDVDLRENAEALALKGFGGPPNGFIETDGQHLAEVVTHRSWMTDHTSARALRWFGAIETDRCLARDMFNGARADGLNVRIDTA